MNARGPEAAAASAREMRSSALPPVKCLLVDDRAENLVGLRALVAQDGVEVLEAGSGPEALEILFADSDVALALIDVHMPEMDGFELAEVMRGSERTRAIPIIFITADASDHKRHFKGYDAGAVDFIYKPVEPVILRNKVAVFVELGRQRQRLDRELEERTATLRLHEMFTAVLGHDLRNPLGVIMMLAELTRRRATDPQVRENAERIAEAGESMGRLVRDMLDLARARLAGGFALNPAPIALDELLRNIVADFATSHPQRRIDVDIAAPVEGRWDADRIAQAARNLIANALQHGTPGEPVRIGLRDGAGARVVLWVENHGEIPRDLLGHIFDPFRGGQAPGARKDGLGLGLYIVQQIAHAHGGDVVIAPSEGPTTRFELELPRG
jgi:signal transduction histidine kinase